ncbi:MAG: M14 family zinc carboxypeptidase [Vicinamibacterales bacterium]
MTRAFSLRPAQAAAAVLFLIALVTTSAAPAARQQTRSAQRIDEAYTKLIREHSTEKRVMTELVDHLPASDSVPTPLKFLGYVPGTPGKLTYHSEIVRYLEALDKASDRVTLTVIGKSDEGRDMVSVAIADEATIRNLEKYKQITAELGDPRKISDEHARQLVAAGKPIYYALGSIHSTEYGSPEMLMELAYRMAVGESPFIQQIRNNIIFVLTPSTEVDGRERAVDNFRFQQANPGEPAPGMVYWGKYVAHDNNRDAMGQGLRLTQVMMKTFLDWHPTVWHDLHESVTLLYTSTGTGPYNPIVDAIQVDEWWLLAKTEIMEMTKRGVPGVWTYNFYDGWVPNYLFWIANTHNSIGRFYETQSYRGVNYALGAAQSREWYRPNPTPAGVQWGPRSNINMQQSAILLAMNHVAKNKETYLDNYYVKSKRAIARGNEGTDVPNAYVIPAAQHTAAHAADLVNLVRVQGGEVHRATAAFKAGGVDVAAGDYILRMDQPYGPLVETIMGVQWYPPDNPRPYDDLGWTFPYLRNVKHDVIRDKAILTQPMTLMAADAKLAGGASGTGRTLVINHTTDNNLATFRFMHPNVKMLAGEKEFEAGGKRFVAGSFIIPDADRAALDKSLTALGITAVAVDAVPTVATHDLDVPRVGYIHTWTNTQDEGWVRLAFDHYKIPYTYFADNTIRAGANLKSKYDVIIFPHTSGSAASILTGRQGPTPVPYKKSSVTPNMGGVDETDDMRGGLTRDGLRELERFVAEGGVLITEGVTSTLFPEYRLTEGVTIEQASGLWVPGSVLKANIADRSSPLAYGYNQNSIGVYFDSSPVMRVGNAGFGGGRGRAGGPDLGQPNQQPNAAAPRLTTLEGGTAPTPAGARAGAGGGGRGAGQGRGGGGRGGAPSTSATASGPRVILQFPDDADDLLLSGGMVGGEALTGRAVLVDAPLGKGHVVMFATRPYWRWQTHGLFFLGFNAILNWNDLDAGRPKPTTPTNQGGQ